MNKLKLVALIILTLTLFNGYSTNYTWTGATNNNWELASNWSPSTGFPTNGDTATINFGGAIVELNGATQINRLYLNNGTLHLKGNTLTVDTSIYINSAVIDNGTYAAGKIIGDSIANYEFRSSTSNSELEIYSDLWSDCGGNTYNGKVFYTHTGSGNSDLRGANIYNNTVIFKTVNGRFRPESSANTTFNGDTLFLINNSVINESIYLSQAASATINCQINFNGSSNGYTRIGSNGSSLGEIILNGASNFSIGNLTDGNIALYYVKQQNANNINLTTLDSVGCYFYNDTILGNLTVAAGKIIVNNNNFSGTVSLNKTGPTSNNSNGGNTFNSSLTLTHSGANNFLFSNVDPDIFNGDVTLIVSGTGNIYLANKGIGNMFNENIFINYVSDQHIYIGNSTGTSTLANTKTISVIGVGAFGTGNLTLKGFTQLGNTAQAITLTNNGILSLGPNTTFNADLFTTTPRLYIRESIFNGNVVFDKNGTSNNDSYGGNTYNGTFAITNSGSARLRLANNVANTYNSTVTFSSTGSGLLEPSRGGNSIFNDDIYFNSTNNSTGIQFGNGAGTAILAATKTVNIGGLGFSAGELRFRGFTQPGNTPQSLTLTGTALLSNYDANWGGNITFTAPRNASRGTIYNGTAYLEKTGASNDVSYGGNIFTQDVTFVNSGSGYFMIGNGTFDTYSGNVTINNTGTDNMYFARNGVGHVVTGNLIVNNTATGTNNYVHISSQSGASLSVNGTATFNNSGSATNNRIYVGNGGDITFNSTVDLNNIGTGANSEIYCNYSVSSNVTYNGNITLTSTNGSGIRFGEGGGSCTLADTKTITVDAGGFTVGELRLHNFTQIGNTPQLITLAGNAILRFREGNVFNADFTSASPRLFIEGGTFNGVTSLIKNGNANDDSRGGSIFNGNTIITNSSSNRIRLNNNNSYADDFNGSITFIKAGSGAIEVASVGESTFSGNIIINSATPITFGVYGGVAQFDGGLAQGINDAIGTSAIPEFYRLKMNKPNNQLALNMPINVRNSLTLTSGNINTTSANILTMADNSTVLAVSNNSFISGPIQKIGNDAFTFPVGNGGYYAPISISAPSNNTDAFRAEYFPNGPVNLPTDTTSIEPSIDHVSRMEAWYLDRTTGTSNVNVTLSWDSIRSGRVTMPNELIVSRWDGSTWIDEGNSGTTGTTTTGTVNSGAAVSSFNASTPFTIGTTTNNNSLPVKLTVFTAELNNSVVELSWQTASEINNDYFTIEKSENGTNWEVVTQTKGAGNSNIMLNYKATDNSPSYGVSYYRLKQTDFNGDFTYSEIETINKKQENITFYPNPFQSTISTKNICDDCKINVYSSLGQLIYNGKENTINTQNWSKGIYQVVIINGDKVIQNNTLIK